MQCQQSNANGTACQRSTWIWWGGVTPLCHAHFLQVLRGGRPVPDTFVVAAMNRTIRYIQTSPRYRHGLPDVGTHASRRPTMGEVQVGWLMDLGEPYGWAAVTRVDPLPPPVDGVPRVRVHFVTQLGHRPQHVCTRDEPAYPYRRPAAGAA